MFMVIHKQKQSKWQMQILQQVLKFLSVTSISVDGALAANISAGILSTVANTASLVTITSASLMKVQIYLRYWTWYGRYTNWSYSRTWATATVTGRKHLVQSIQLHQLQLRLACQLEWKELIQQWFQDN